MNWRQFERVETLWEWLIQHKIHLIVLGILIADIILLVALYEPLRWWHQQKARELLARQKYTRELKQALNEWTTALQRLRAARAERQRLLAEQFPDESIGYNLTRNFLEEVAQSSGVLKKDINYSNKDIGTMNLSEFSLTVPVSGTYEQVRRFIQALETTPRFLILESIRLRTTGRQNIVEVDLQLRTYFTRIRSRGTS